MHQLIAFLTDIIATVLLCSVLGDGTEPPKLFQYPKQDEDSWCIGDWYMSSAGYIRRPDGNWYTKKGVLVHVQGRRFPNRFPNETPRP